MFVHITPEANAIGETISTLKFAERVGSIELGAARSITNHFLLFISKINFKIIILYIKL